MVRFSSSRAKHTLVLGEDMGWDLVSLMSFNNARPLDIGDRDSSLVEHWRWV